MSNAAALVARGDVIVRSETLCDEMWTFLNIGLDEWQAAPGCYDDTVIAWALALLSAYDERVGSNPGGEEMPPAKGATKAPWKYHDVDEDLDDSSAHAAVTIEPWKG